MKTVMTIIMKPKLEMKYIEIRKYEQKLISLSELLLRLSNIDFHFDLIEEEKKAA